FSRAPVAGKTKTRLIGALGAEGAKDFHAACLNDLIAEARAWKATRGATGQEAGVHLFITPPGAQAAFRVTGVNWPKDFSLHDQRGESLGERMADAFATVLRRVEGPRGVVLVGTDLPLLTAAHLDAATEALAGTGALAGADTPAGADVVFGPSADGGFYLVALKGPPGALFGLSGWGGDTVLEDSLAQARRLGKTAALIGELPDADTPENLAALLAHPLAASLAQRESLRFLRNLVK
ncbi:MAG: TIGR04282 family arsenosugar biosynthesis glycosyltransferase, partial [bacterium]